MKKALALFAGAALLCLAVPQAQAQTFTFNDNWTNWPGYDFGDTSDVHGSNPDVTQMIINTDDATGNLTTVNVVFAATTDRLTYDSLFINSYNLTANGTNWDDWDYLVHDGGKHGAGQTLDGEGNANQANVPNDGLYSVHDDYRYTTAAAYRTGNPNGIDARDLSLLDNMFTPSWDNVTHILTYDFTSQNIDVSDGFFFAYAPWCANDVMGTPEPATMLLFGTGLIGLIGIGRKRSKRS